MKNKPKAIVIAASASPGQAFRARFRVFCQGAGGEFTFARTGSLNGSQSATKVVHIPKKRRSSHCTVEAGIDLEGGNSGGSGKLTLAERT